MAVDKGEGRGGSPTRKSYEAMLILPQLSDFCLHRTGVCLLTMHFRVIKRREILLDPSSRGHR